MRNTMIAIFVFFLSPTTHSLAESTKNTFPKVEYRPVPFKKMDSKTNFVEANTYPKPKCSNFTAGNFKLGSNISRKYLKYRTMNSSYEGKDYFSIFEFEQGGLNWTIYTTEKILGRHAIFQIEAKKSEDYYDSPIIMNDAKMEDYFNQATKKYGKPQKEHQHSESLKRGGLLGKTWAYSRSKSRGWGKCSVDGRFLACEPGVFVNDSQFDVIKGESDTSSNRTFQLVAKCPKLIHYSEMKGEQARGAAQAKEGEIKF